MDKQQVQHDQPQFLPEFPMYAKITKIIGRKFGEKKTTSMILLTDRQALDKLIRSELGGLSPDEVLVHVYKGRKKKRVLLRNGWVVEHSHSFNTQEHSQTPCNHVVKDNGADQKRNKS